MDIKFCIPEDRDTWGIKEHMSDKCKYDICWKGRCDNDALSGKDYCKEHLDKKCTHCNEQAIGECHKYNGSFPCGSPVCQEHKITNHNH